MTQVIAMMPVRNEAWILDKTLKALSAFCDRILVADQFSTDGTRDILSKYNPKVTVFDNPSPNHNTAIRWKLLELARNYGDRNLLFFTDADEIFGSNILEGDLLDRLISLPAGTSITVELVNLWRSPRRWRNDESVWSQRWMRVGFRDDGATKHGPSTETLDHNSRVPPFEKNVTLQDLKLMHFQFINFDRMLSKQRRYRAMEAMELGEKHAEGINLRYGITKDERKVRLSDVNAEWFEGWSKLGIDLDNFDDSTVYWYDVEVLRYFEKMGIDFFSPIDLWDADWEEKRQIAHSFGYDGIPQDAIVDPRTFEQKTYHAYLRRFFRTPPWRDPYKMVRGALSGCRRSLKTLGIRRRHLKKIGL
ncbi:MAG: glycosyltransferase family 2 protein [Deltaproteobacteria bacterium]|nr:glycosyltransferase family 2 protein [Deltaproteobacteria bacterium]